VNRLSLDDIQIGKPLPWDCFDKTGALLLRKGVVVSSTRQIEGLMTRGLYVTGRPSEAAPPPPVAKLTPFDHLDEFKLRLRSILEGIANAAQNAEIPTRLIKLIGDIQAICEEDADAALGMLHLDVENRYTIVHPLHVAILCELIARKKELPVDERQIIIGAALTANVAMMELQEQLQKQDGPLTDAQKEEIRLHPLYSVDMMLTVGVNDDRWIAAVLHHHEKLDGSGYPGAFSGDAIPLSVRILSLADTYSAMLAPRIYRSSMMAKDALREVFLKRGSEIDGELAQIFIKELGVFPPGAFVTLKNGETAIVIRRGENTMKPIVRSVIGPRGAPLASCIKRDTSDEDYAIRDMVARDRVVKLDVRKLWGYT
jgi:HD-GYP domain-containing protein (c-di-GMP phosphodiesterase class II)